jgi:hypothetical protein
LLDTRKAPFRLLAIVNRFDLRESSLYGASAAELRFVFCAVDTSKPGGDAAPFLVIFEFGKPLKNFQEVRKYARDWAGLSDPALTDSQYLDRLGKITEDVVLPVAVSTGTSHSNLHQIRTEEMLFNPPGKSGWEFREFIRDAAFHLRSHTLANTPDPWVNKYPLALRQWLTENAEDILAGGHTLPPVMKMIASDSGAILGNRKLLAAVADSETNDWLSSTTALPPATETVRRAFISATCNGCHSMSGCQRQVTDLRFMSHVETRKPGNAAEISPFLTNDLKRRAQNLRNAAEASLELPLDEFFVTPLTEPH